MDLEELTKNQTARNIASKTFLASYIAGEAALYQIGLNELEKIPQNFEVAQYAGAFGLGIGLACALGVGLGMYEKIK